MVENMLKVLIVGPMGVGKSQICNFFKKIGQILKIESVILLNHVLKTLNLMYLKEFRHILILLIQLEIMTQMKLIL